MIRTVLLFARIALELAYDIACEVLRPQPIPHRAPVGPATQRSRQAKPPVWN